MQYEEARSSFAAALSLYDLFDDEASHPLKSNLHEYIGRCHAREKHVDLAEESFRRSIALNPANTVASHMLASIVGSNLATAPADYVEKLFDDYSETFESSLAGPISVSLPEQ